MSIYNFNKEEIETGGSAPVEISDALEYLESSVINKSRNLNDEVYERGYFNQTTGVEVENANTFRNKNYLPVEGGRKIAVYGEMLDGSPMYNTVYIVQYDADKNIILCSKILPYPATKNMSCVFTLQENTSFIRLSQNNTSVYYDTDLARITIVYDEYFSTTNFTYEPYYYPALDIPKTKSVAILGDSYSTYGGWIPTNYAAWYGDDKPDKGITDVSQTWWYQLIKDNGLRLLINSSFSGSAISKGSGFNGQSFIKRMVDDLGEKKVTAEKPQMIFIMGGLNDSGAELGEVQYSDWTEDDLAMFLPAFCYMLQYLKKYNPTAIIVVCILDVLPTDKKEGMRIACDHYGVPYCAVRNLGAYQALVSGHPDIKGHLMIKKDIEAFLRKNDII